MQRIAGRSTITIGGSLLILLFMWVVENKEIQSYADDWLENRVRARQLLASQLAETAILETYYANQMMSSAEG